MEKTRKITTILVLAVAFCLLSVSLAEAITQYWAADNLQNKKWPAKIPIWKIIQDAVPGKSVVWVDHTPNPRFAIYDPGTPGNESDDLVLDKETGLIWARDANLYGGTKTWQDAIYYCRMNVTLGNRKGWRLPTVEELSSLVDPSQSYPTLPSGYPFINVQSIFYWSSTTYESVSGYAWGVIMESGYVGYGYRKSDYAGYVWPVRGSNGYATGNW